MSKINVECTDPEGKQIYDRIIQTNLEDLVLGKSILQVTMICNLEEPYFIIGALPKSTSRAISLRDIAEISEEIKQDDKVIKKLTIIDETYAPKLLEKIAVLDQPSRLEIVTDSDIELNTKIYDAKDEFIDKVLDFMNRVFPEGMRVRQTLHGKSIVMVASEKPIAPEWLKEANDLKETLENQ
ncbi:methanogenesis marker 17 protein [Methanococcus voltae]|uniref:Putative methanogenesis marker protein 17 n=1 Tax=Methanococcus voltae TaxID=2188 RepID=A0A8J7RGK9_METVO|nr:methanogenesis marker 17 protein [Methanococcus voltae]MBP2172591.1 putative methanogenesis marker protein 17 [Methanococcus voltae]MBP2201502.1 putative methanogenesis marker protein 17 [Methanococcus voltae]